MGFVIGLDTLNVTLHVLVDALDMILWDLQLGRTHSI